MRILTIGILFASLYLTSPLSAATKFWPRPRVTSASTAPAYNPAFVPHRIAGYVPVRIGDQVKLIRRDRLIVVDQVIYVIPAR
jgi:hypothetical protein